MGVPEIGKRDYESSSDFQHLPVITPDGPKQSITTRTTRFALQSTIPKYKRQKNDTLSM